MGKHLRQQKAGKGSPSYRRPSHRFKSDAKYREYDEVERRGKLVGEVIGFVGDPSRSALLMDVVFENKERKLLIAPEGVKIGDRIEVGANAEVRVGNILPLSSVPDGAPVFNLEIIPGDGGRLVRSAGTSGAVVSHEEKGVVVKLPSKRMILLNPGCRVQIGVVSGGGRLELPLMTAGNAFRKHKALNRAWPKVRGVKMNAYNHPFGGKQHHPGKSTMTSRGAPPGRKVGHIAARRTGRKKGKRIVRG